VQRYAGIIMAMIREDQETGQVPRDICSWDELDESMDAEIITGLPGCPQGSPTS
jgi:hypothetical protein